MLVLQFLLLKQRVSIVCKVQYRGKVTVQVGELLKQYFCVTSDLCESETISCSASILMATLSADSSVANKKTLLTKK